MRLDHLNPPQREAVLHGEGPLLILAGAGSGKTNTMTHRIAHLIAKRGVAPGRIVGLSFTNKAAKELKERVKKLTGVPRAKAGEAPLITTFHSLCVRLLRRYADKLGYRSDFTILDEHDQTEILREALRATKIDDRKFDTDWIRFQIGQAKNRFLPADAAEEFLLGSDKGMPADYGIAAATAFRGYQERLKTLNALDFDDLLYQGVRLLEDHADVRERCNDYFLYILVDEYQDTNPAQFRLLELLTQKQQNICVVGDDDQSIYAWRGADPTHILEFDRHYPGARVITLDQNYRSTSTILNAANQVISKNSVRHAKTLWSDRGEGEALVQMIVEDDRAEGEAVAEELNKLGRRAHEGVVTQIRPWADFAVLYRSNTQARIFEESLRMLGIPYKIVGGMSFLDRKEIKDALSYWRLICNLGDDVSFRRVVNWPPRGIGKTTIEAHNTHALEAGLPLLQSVPDSPVASKLAAFRELILGLRESLERVAPEPAALSVWARESLVQVGFKQGLLADHDDPVQAEKRWEIALEMTHALGQIKLDELDVVKPITARGILQAYLAKLTLEARDEQEDDKKPRDEVTLLTLHGSKGLEYPVVFLVGMEEGLLPHKRVLAEATDLSEERRLCYVGITRAKDRLYLTRAKNRIRYGKPVPREPSRFLAEIPPDLMVIRDESHSPETKEAQQEHEVRVKSYLDQIRSQLMAKK